MTTRNSINQTPRQNKLMLMLRFALAIIIGQLAVSGAKAASQTWTNAPADATWANTNNWVGHAVPGAFVPAGGAQSPDIATFNTPLFSGIGGSGNPITIDELPVGTAITNREVGGFLFDTANCGAYVIGSPSGNNLELTASYNNATIGSNITVTATVVNPIVFSGPIHFHFSSSANGGYQFTNNAAPSTATLTFNMITNDSATSRPLTLVLAGSNTGSNSIAHFDDNAGANGSVHLIKGGAGRWVFTGPNNFPQKTSAGDNIPANIFIAGGILEVQDPGSLGAITVGNLVVSNTGVLQIDNVTPANNGFTLKNGGTIQMNGSGTVNGVTAANIPANSGTLATTSSSDVMTVGNAANQPTGGAADTLLHIAGPGTVALAQAANYIGKWSVDAGTLQLNGGSIGTSPNLNIGAGGTFDVSPLGGSYSLTAAGLSASGAGTTPGSTAASINAASGATIDLATGAKPLSLTFTPTSSSGDTTHPALYIPQGILSLGGNFFTVNNASGSPLGAGTYTLITQASGTVTDGGGYAAAITGSGKAAGTVASIQVSGGNVNLVLTAYVAQNLIWTGGITANWNVNTDSNWLNGASATVFNASDNVTFNPAGSTNPAVNLVSTLAPGNVVVDTSANNYTFSGSGTIAGTTALTKLSPGTLTLNTVNTYSGGTIISNGVIQIGVANAIPSTGSGDVAIVNTGLLDLNGQNDAVNALIGNGTVDNVTSGGASVLTVGNNGDSGTFSGSIQNTTGTVGLTMAGNGIETLTASNSYAGPTTINAGTLRLKNYNALGLSAVSINGGTLDVATNILATINDIGGTIANNSTSTTNTLEITNASTINSVIANGTGGGGVKVLVDSGATLRLNAANTYSGGTVLANSGNLNIGGGTANAGTGGIIASNNTSIGQPNTGSSSSAPGNTITTADGATVRFTSGTTANNFGGQFVGSATATNIFVNGNMSIGGTASFSNFLGTVIMTNATVRMGPNVGFMGGDNTTFNFVNGGGMYTRDAGTVRVGALTGNGVIGNPSNPFGNYSIGGKNIYSEYSGSISGSNNIIKVGNNTLLLDGVTITTNTDSSTYTNYLYGSGLISYLGATTISNGVLALAAPNNLANSPTITLAGTAAILDASQMGIVSNFNDINSNPDSTLVTNGIFEVLATTPNGTPQTLNGFGTIYGGLLADAGSTLNPGNKAGAINSGTGTGVLNVTNTASIFGAVNMRLNSTNTVKADELTATSFTIDPGATLTVTNIGPLAAGTFQLFNHAVSFASITLPTVVAPFVLTNNLAVDGSIIVGNTNPAVPAPAASFAAITSTNIFVTQSVTFTNTSTGGITNSAWTFGDGNTANLNGANVTNNVSNTYNTPGTYTVQLIVSGPGGAGTNTQTAYITVKARVAIGRPVLSGGNFILGGTNGPAGQTYRILSSTNVALPVINWTPVYTNVFAADGSYTYTNAPLTNMATFFKLVSP